MHEARPCKPCRKRKTAQGKASWPAGHLRASASPGPPQLSSPLYKQLRKTAGQSCRTSTNGQFFARSSPLQAVSQEKDSAGQSFVARGPPACFGQPSHSRANGQFVVQSSPLQAASEDSARQSCVARTVPQLAQALTVSFLHEARPCKPCRKRKTAQGKASWPAGHLRASASPGPPQLAQPRYRAVCRTKLAPTVSQDEDSVGQSFVRICGRAMLRGPRATCVLRPGPGRCKLFRQPDTQIAGKSFRGRGPATTALVAIFGLRLCEPCLSLQALARRRKTPPSSWIQRRGKVNSLAGLSSRRRDSMLCRPRFGLALSSIQTSHRTRFGPSLRSIHRTRFGQQPCPEFARSLFGVHSEFVWSSEFAWSLFGVGSRGTWGL